MKSVFHPFEWDFIEAGKTTFFGGESPTLRIKRIF